MKLFYSPASPYVRKVMAVAHETGLADRIELLDAAAHPINRDQRIVAHNPLGKVPCLILDDGLAVFDSRVICAHLDTLHNGAKLIPADGRARLEAQVLEALADGLLDAALLCRYEAVVRPEDKRWDAWFAGQMAKIDSSLDQLEQRWTATLTARADLGAIAVACALGYLDFRFADKDWRATRPALAAWHSEFDRRPAMLATRPKG